MTAPAQPIEQPAARVFAWRPAFIRSVPLRLSVFLICLLWTIPTLGLLVTSVRIRRTSRPRLVDGAAPSVRSQPWTLTTTRPSSERWDGQRVHQQPDRDHPSVAIPITIAAFAAYAFAWVPFRGRGLLFTIVVALLVVPIQMSLIPICGLLRREPVRLIPRHLAGAYGLRSAADDAPALQLHVALPRDLFESAAIDGATHLQTFMRLVLPLSIRLLVRSPSSSSCGSGMTCWWPSSSSGRVPTSRPAAGPVHAHRKPRRLMASSDRRRVRHDGRAAGRLPAPPAGFGARDPGRLVSGDPGAAGAGRRSRRTRSRAHAMGLRDERFEQPAGAGVSSTPRRRIRPDRGGGAGAPAPVRRYRRARHLRQRRDLRAVPAGDPKRLVVALAAPWTITLYGARPDMADALVIGMSQSGRSPDIVAVVEEANGRER